MQGVYSRAISCIDEGFARDPGGKLSLGIQTGGDSFAYSIFDKEQNKFLAAESYVIHKGVDLAGFLSELTGQLPLLKGPFESMRVLTESRRYTLVPSPLFDPAEANRYFQFNIPPVPGEAVLHDSLSHLDIYTVYGIDESIPGVLSRFFPGHSMMHHASVLMESTWIRYKNQLNTDRVFLNIRDQQFDIMVMNSRHMRFCNSFPFTTPEDLLYYVIFVMEQLGLNPEETVTSLMGQVEKNSLVHDALYKYIREVDFVERNDAFRYSYVFNEIPGHYFYTLLNYPVCGS